MEDQDLERTIKAAREAIEDSELADPHKEALHESLDQAAKSANGSTEKLHDLTVAFCKSVIRSTRSDITFKDRVIDAVQGPLDKLREDIIEAVASLINSHTNSCPYKGEKTAPTTFWDVAKAAVTNKWFCIAIAVATFSPNIVSIVGMFRK
jgi:hypothetical protein